MKRLRKYNKRLLPRKNYNIIDSSKVGRFHLCRMPEKKERSILKDSDLNKYFPTSQFAAGLSVNLLGEFTHADADVRVMGDYTQAHHQPWNPGDSYILPYAIRIRPKSHFLAIRVRDVQAVVPITIKVSYPNQGEREEKAFLKVIHRPTKCNFWHFEIQVWNKTDDGVVHFLKDSTLFTSDDSSRILKKYAKVLKRGLMEKIKHSTEIRRSYLPKKIYRNK